MVRLLIHTAPAPRHPTDEKINAGQFQPGDVVTMIEDNQEWRPGDKGPWNDTVDIPGYTVDDLAHLMAAEVKTTMRVDPISLETVYDTEQVQMRQWNVKNIAALKLASGLIRGAKGQEMIFTNNYFKQTLKAAPPDIKGD